MIARVKGSTALAMYIISRVADVDIFLDRPRHTTHYSFENDRWIEEEQICMRVLARNRRNFSCYHLSLRSKQIFRDKPRTQTNIG